MALGLSLIIFGALGILAFAYVNIVLQPKWYPIEISTEGSTRTARAPGAPSHMTLGIIIAALFCIGVTFVTAGCVELGILYSRG